jgi:purine-binding chemotaxis protein CheW
MPNILTNDSVERADQPMGAISTSSGEHKQAPAEDLLVVGIGSNWYAIAAGAVAEICDFSQPTALPHAPAHVLGLINVRGRAVPVLDLREYLGLSAPRAASEGSAESLVSGLRRRRIAVVEAAGMRVGIVCDVVKGVLAVSRDRIRTSPPILGAKEREFVRAEVVITGGMALVLDAEKLLSAASIQR